MVKNQINSTEYNPYFDRYLSYVPNDTPIRTGLFDMATISNNFISNLSNDQLNYAYDKDKWTIKEVLQHIIDTERIFAYRLLRVGRGDKTPLVGFDQDVYIPTSHANEKTGTDLLAEYNTTRNYTLSILNSLKDKDLISIGSAGGFDISARAMVFIIMGHEKHHMEVIKERYL